MEKDKSEKPLKAWETELSVTEDTTAFPVVSPLRNSRYDLLILQYNIQGIYWLHHDLKRCDIKQSGEDGRGKEPGKSSE